MLPAAARLRRREDFSLVVRRGRRAGRQTLVAHYLPADPVSAGPALSSADGAPSPASAGPTPAPASAGPALSSAVPAPGRAAAGDAALAAGPGRAGFVVGRAVGNSVVRHRVIRRLRHLVRDRLGSLPAGSRLVVRALPPAAAADSAALGRDLDAALAKLGLPVVRPPAAEVFR